MPAFPRQRDRAGLLALSPIQSMPVSAALMRVHTSLASRATTRLRMFSPWSFLLGLRQTTPRNSMTFSVSSCSPPDSLRQISLTLRSQDFFQGYLSFLRIYCECLVQDEDLLRPRAASVRNRNQYRKILRFQRPLRIPASINHNSPSGRISKDTM
jgi:hypothetical protein